MSESLKQELAHYLTAAGLSQVSVIASLTQGLSNRNYYVRGVHASKGSESEWVLRLNSWASTQICDRRSEVAAWRDASEAGFAPNIVYISPEKDFYLSQFLAQNDNRSWNELNSANSSHPISNTEQSWPKAEQLLLQLLNGLKELPIPKNVITVEQQWQIYYSRLSQMQQQLLFQRSSSSSSSAAWLHQFELLLAQDNAISEMLSLHERCLIKNQFSHRDLNPFNILLVQDRLNCIDFEYACSSHPLCDLASVISSHSLSSKQRQWLIESYLSNQANLNHHAQDAIPAAVDLYWVFAVCWALQMAFDSMTLDGKLNADTDKIKQAESYLVCASQYQTLIGSCS
ncbi:phosphotransferase [Shewanella kaireitica]|uniref:phosphotransferase n=1 Tax=Shewanella kaireitica TaxID=212021 RepID=UPI00200E6850|nr:phosphotransferase [Shewanella kaireitica]